MDLHQPILLKYKEILKRYIEDQDEQSLYLGQKFSRKAIEQEIPPEEFITLHRTVMLELFPDMPKEFVHSYDFLIEVMMGYGLAYQEHQSLRNQQQELKTELEVAAGVQQTLLETSVPSLDGLDIGVVSVPSKQMNGDYYHFVSDETDNRVSVAIADVIGKGIPAALCMSMIKYAMDSLPNTRNTPDFVLENLNRVVEQNVDLNMFITMLYGIYQTENHLFTYSTAGHEPGFYYNFQKDEFTDMKTKGLVLGVDRNTKYRQFQQKVDKGDMIILVSDGVTECRTEDGFIERARITEHLRRYLHLPSQEIAQNIYRDFERLQDFQLRDDFTLIILKRNV